VRKQKAAREKAARQSCALRLRDANPVCRCFRRPAEYTAGWGEGAILRESGPQMRLQDSDRG
jgi:hypothetical protein